MYTQNNTLLEIIYWFEIINSSFSQKVSLKNNNYLDFQQEIINYFWLIFCNSKTHQIHTSVDWKLDCETHERQSFPLPTFQLARNNLPDFSVLVSIQALMWNGEWANNEANTNFP